MSEDLDKKEEELEGTEESQENYEEKVELESDEKAPTVKPEYNLADLEADKTKKRAAGTNLLMGINKSLGYLEEGFQGNSLGILFGLLNLKDEFKKFGKARKALKEAKKKVAMELDPKDPSSVAEAKPNKEAPSGETKKQEGPETKGSTVDVPANGSVETNQPALNSAANTQAVKQEQLAMSINSERQYPPEPPKGVTIEQKQVKTMKFLKRMKNSSALRAKKGLKVDKSFVQGVNNKLEATKISIASTKPKSKSKGPSASKPK